MHSKQISSDTIVAISTPPGRGGIGIVRLSGPRAVEIASPMLLLQNPLAAAQARVGSILDRDVDGELVIDTAVVTLFAGPNSYTGEDVLEITAHGSPVVLEFLVRGACERGARLARPGEFTERAFLNGRIDLTQAEAVRDLIDAQTLYQAKVAAQQMNGALSRRVAPIKARLVELIATLEAGIDFAEDDIDVLPDAEIARRIADVREPLEMLASSFALGRVIQEGLTLAIVGRPNVGKSSLFNRLVQRERAIVTAEPGTTRDLVVERVSLGGIPVQLVDTAGLREAVGEAERIGIEKSREALADADIVLLVLDANEAINAEELALMAELSERKALMVVNKIDLVENGAGEGQRASLGGLPVAETSARTGLGIGELREQVISLVSGGGLAEPGMLTNLRQQQAVTGALEGLTAASGALAARVPHEMLLMDLYGALRPLDGLTGETTADDVLNLIFSTFCIGK